MPKKSTKAAGEAAPPTAPAKGPTRGRGRAGATKAAPTGKPATRAATGRVRGKATKQDTVIALLRRPHGGSISEMMEATGWLAHSVRGFMSGALKKRLGLEVVSEKGSGERRYHIVALRTDGERE